jgi:dolichol-phosphate mannosyltransferase
MATSQNRLISFVVPLHNEATGLEDFHNSLRSHIVAAGIKTYEIIYIDDGSTDDTAARIHFFAKTDPTTKLIALSRNFGKEYALSAGIAQAHGDAIIMLDGDGQHPFELIPKLIMAWEHGAQVVIGVRTHNSGEGMVKRLGSRLFYWLFNILTGNKIEPGATDYRLIDRAVQKAFLTLKENGRITRGLIDWLGFKRVLIPFKANSRTNGLGRYNLRKLTNLATNSFVSMTPVPLYLFGYLGVFITLAAILSGTGIIIEQLILGDPLGWNITGTAMLGILIIFLVGIVLMSQGIISLYISHIQNQGKQRPLYIIDYEKSVGIIDNGKE